MELHITSREAAATLEELLDRVSGKGDTVVIEREGKPPVQLVSTSPTNAPPSLAGASTGTMADLVEILRAWPRQDDGWAEGVEEAVRFGNQPMSLEDPWDR